MTYALQIIAGVVGIVASWYLSKKLLMWWQAYRNRRQVGEVTDARTQAQRDNQAANAESDKLKEIDGR